MAKRYIISSPSRRRRILECYKAKGKNLSRLGKPDKPPSKPPSKKDPPAALKSLTVSI